jgi:ribonuclease J
VDGAGGLVIADFSARNFERLKSFKTIARRTGRELVVTARDLYMLHALCCADGSERWKGLRVYDEITDHTKRKWEEEVVLPLAGSQYISHREIRANPDGFILCFSFFDMNHLLDIKPDGGIYIYSSCEPFNEEMEIDFRRLSQWLTHFRIMPFGFSLERSTMGESIPVMHRGYHASGHATGEDVLTLIDTIDPEIIIPVHTESRGWFREHFENVLLPEEGLRYEF